MTVAPADNIPRLTTLTLWIMTITVGLVVANIYYNQPLLDDMALTYHITKAKAGQISMFTQIGYAVGMLFIVPLADMLRRKRLIYINFGVAIFSLLLTAISPTINILLLASLLVGASSVITHLLVPITAHLARPEERGKKIGFVMSGLLIGVLLSRTLSGVIGAHFGWRAIFYIAAGLMLVMWILILLYLPDIEPDHKGNYRQLLRSMIQLIKDEPKLRLASVRGALSFACFSAFWTTLVFLLREEFNKGSDVAGMFGLVGAFGALAAGLMGRLSDKMDAFKLTSCALLLIVISFIVFSFSTHSISGLVIGVIIMDMGVQATHISNQTVIFSLNPQARNRINTIYMVSYFIGGATGTFLASQLYHSYHWAGVCAIGIILSFCGLLIHLFNKRVIQKKPATVQS